MDDPLLMSSLTSLRTVAISLPVATVLGGALAFRPRRRGTAPRVPAVVQTQILLALVGTLVMLVIGESIARAFGIVGVAGLVRYRTKISDPKDAGVMLATLGIGLASGVGAYALAAFATAFILVVLWFIESLSQTPYKTLSLKISTPSPAEMYPKLERVLRRMRISAEILKCSSDELCYELQLPLRVRPEEVASLIIGLDGSHRTSVEWSKSKAKAA